MDIIGDYGGLTNRKCTADSMGGGPRGLVKNKKINIWIIMTYIYLAFTLPHRICIMLIGDNTGKSAYFSQTNKCQKDKLNL